MHPPSSSARVLQASAKIRPSHYQMRTSCKVHITYNKQTEEKEVLLYLEVWTDMAD